MSKDDETPDTEELESEDTSEEEDTEEESSENEEQEESTEDEESDESEEETEEDDSTDSKTKQHIDLKRLPPELKEAGRRMLASHSKAMQRIPELIKQKVEEANVQLQQQYATAIVKAKGFDDLTNLADFKKFWEDVEGGRPYGYSSMFRKNGKAAASEDDFSAPSGDSEKGTDINSIVESLMPRIASLIKAEVGPLKEEKAKSVWADAEKNLPNFNKYRAAITAKLSQHPTLTVADAYELVAGKDRAREETLAELRKAEEKSKKIPKRSLKPGSGGTKPLSKGTIKSIEDALQHAKSDLTRASGG